MIDEEHLLGEIMCLAESMEECGRRIGAAASDNWASRIKSVSRSIATNNQDCSRYS